MKIRNQLINLSLILVFAISANLTQAQDLKQQIDAYVNSQFSTASPGVSLLIAKNGRIIYQNAFGMANLELGVKAKSNNVFEIGSITKQFTAIAILMLEEQHKLKVTDDITKYIPDYPTQGKTITIHNLLNHTSGIKSYTNMPSFMSSARTDLSPVELIDVFKNEPMEFDPGTQFNYNNSGYILLGHIIEVVSGMSYADFLQTHIFDKVGMKNSYYGSMVTLIPNRASGYSEAEAGYRNANYLSLTLPYAAGSIMSTTEDLLKWQNALSANSLVKRSTLEKAINGSTLNSGEAIPYGYGWSKGNLNGSKTVEHSGGIFGYSSNGIFLPEENVYVVGLTNCDCGDVGGITSNIAAMAIGKPFPKKEDAITLTEAQLKKWVGAYEYDGNVTRYVTLENGQLSSLREGSRTMDIYPMTETNFIFDGGATTYEFYMEDGNRMAKFTANGNTVIGKGVEKAPPSEREILSLPTETLEQYMGTYELRPDFYIVVEVRNNKIFATATGQAELEIYASTKDEFFLKVVPAEVSFGRNASGVVNSLTLKQGGNTMQGMKVD